MSYGIIAEVAACALYPFYGFARFHLRAHVLVKVAKRVLGVAAVGQVWVNRRVVALGYGFYNGVSRVVRGGAQVGVYDFIVNVHAA